MDLRNGLIVARRLRFSPLHMTLFAGVIGLALSFMATMAAMSGPWLGITFSPSERIDGVEVVSVSADGPAFGILHQGEIAVALVGKSETLPLTDYYLVNEPDTINGYREYRSFFESQGKIHKLLQQGVVYFVTKGGNTYQLEPHTSRPITALPWKFWLIIGFGLSAYLIAFSVFIYQPRNMATWSLFLSGVGYFVASLTGSVYLYREIAIDGDFFLALSIVNRLGTIVLGYFFMALLWYYPKKLGDFPVFKASIGVVAALWLNESLCLLEWPEHTFYVHMAAPYLVGAVFSIMQWKGTKNDPVSRAALLWFILATFLSMGFSIILFVLPVVFNGEPFVAIEYLFAFIFALYFGLALGVVKYRLFNLEGWWFATWVWFFSGLSVVIVDLGLVLLLKISLESAIIFSLVIVGWIYFPLRQWLWVKSVDTRKSNLERHVPELIASFFHAATADDFERRWITMLKKMFNPLKCNENKSILVGVSISDDGLRLFVPALDEKSGSIELAFGYQGRRLFSQHDRSLAESMLSLARLSNMLKKSQDKELRLERERIMRDLHDDVAAKILTIVHTSEKQQADLAREALTSLRETIHSLDSTAAMPIDAAVLDLKLKTEKRVDIYNANLEWEEGIGDSTVILEPHRFVNLSKMLTEGVTNALKHAAVSILKVTVMSNKSTIFLSVVNDGCSIPVNEWEPGRGLNHIRQRAREVGGEVNWWMNKDGNECHMHVSIPLERGDNETDIDN